jgi:hypothetical protein
VTLSYTTPLRLPIWPLHEDFEVIQKVAGGGDK